MGPVQRPPARHTPTQHHHICKGRRHHLSPSRRRGLHASTPEVSSCSSTFPVRMVKKKKIWRYSKFKHAPHHLSVLRQLCGIVHTSECCGQRLCKWLLPWTIWGPESCSGVCVLLVLVHRMGVRCSEELCCCFTTTPRLSSSVWIHVGLSDGVNTPSSYKAVYCTLHTVNMVIYSLLCCVYENFLINLEWSFIFIERAEMFFTVFFNIIVG